MKELVFACALAALLGILIGVCASAGLIIIILLIAAYLMTQCLGSFVSGNSPNDSANMCTAIACIVFIVCTGVGALIGSLDEEYDPYDRPRSAPMSNPRRY